METKDKIEVLFSIDADGYIIGYQQEFYDGKAWQTPFDTTNAIEVSQSDLNGISLSATKLIDGQLVLDTSKQAELEAEANKVIPTPEQQMINALGLQNAQLAAQVTALTEKLGGES
ncbi:phage infection protein [Lacticaseibacillus baoqingensis]|uniref:Phage infection protein n=1 Tax=Lacticaseibacillus baoqingensis TaxID=2486013 RepID=A0ABW4E6B2_9LACO|nr:phage infection protein [Lacticaseibacillus baoqingensis]